MRQAVCLIEEPLICCGRISEHQSDNKNIAPFRLKERVLPEFDVTVGRPDGGDEGRCGAFIYAEIQPESSELCLDPIRIRMLGPKSHYRATFG
jgi:hypothetical protein